MSVKNTNKGWREIGNKRHYYKSSWEANIARYFEWLKKSENIAEWEYEPETFWFDGIKRGVCSYLPDFRVTEAGGDKTYYEVKGYMDSKSLTKLKRMRKYHPDIKLILIDKKQYEAIRKSVSKIIAGWE